MSEKVTYEVYCDICKKKMDHIGHSMTLSSYDLDKSDIERDGFYNMYHHKGIDICQDCLNKMKDLFFTINKPDKSTITVKPLNMLMETKLVQTFDMLDLIKK